MVALKVYLSAIFGMLLFGWAPGTVAQLVFGKGTNPYTEFSIQILYGAVGAVVGALAGTAQAVYAATRKYGRVVEGGPTAEV